MTELENRAHAQKALISSDAMRYFVSVTKPEKRNEALDALLKEAKESCQSADEWVVIDLARIETLMDTDDADATANVQNTKTEASTIESLAEAIVTGNLVAAYAMIANRPMVALADATADLDALYRFKMGEQVVISEMLQHESKKYSAQTIKAAVVALTTALDGTYDSEETAVKTAIMKAVNVMSAVS